MKNHPGEVVKGSSDSRGMGLTVEEEGELLLVGMSDETNYLGGIYLNKSDAVQFSEALAFYAEAGKGELVESGDWCEDCEFLEVSEEIVDDRCLSCGCPSSKHFKVKVVKA